MQRQWLLVWESTPAFERTERSTNPLFILIGGLLFTALLALLLIVLTVRRVEHIEQMVGARRFAVPLLVFLVIGAGSFALYSKLRAQEAAFVQRTGRSDEASKIEAAAAQPASMSASPRSGRMAARWTSADGTPYDLWRADAANHVAQLPGLRALEWIDADYRVRWIEPLSGNESVLGLDVHFDARRAAALRRRRRTPRRHAHAAAGPARRATRHSSSTYRSRAKAGSTASSPACSPSRISSPRRCAARRRATSPRPMLHDGRQYLQQCAADTEDSAAR